MRYTALVAYRTWGRIPNGPVHSRPARPSQPRPPGRFGLPKIIESSAVNKCQEASDVEKHTAKVKSVGKMKVDEIKRSPEIKNIDDTENELKATVQQIQPEITTFSKEEVIEFLEDKTKVLNVL